MTQRKPQLVSTALSKAITLQQRLNALVPLIGAPNTPVLMYAQSPSGAPVTANGLYSWTCPAGVTSVNVTVTGAGSGGGGGGGTRGGEGGGGGSCTYAASYPVTPLATYVYYVGKGGTGGMSGQAGQAGEASYFDVNGTAGGVLAAGGSAGIGYVGGAGGAASGEYVSFPGGSGGGNAGQSTGGCGGGGSAGSTAGGSGTTSGGSTGAAGGTAGTGGAAGGAGGAAGGSATAGSSPGAGGGGAGSASPAGLVFRSYTPSSSGSYNGFDATGGGANQRVSMSPSNGTLQQGSTGTGFTYGTQKSVMLLPSSVASDLSGVTITRITLFLDCLTSYLGQAIAALGYASLTSLASSYNGASITSVDRFPVAAGSTTLTDLTSSPLGAALKSGGATALVLGLAPTANVNYRCSFGGAGGGSSAPSLTVDGYTGTAPPQAGNGSDGSVTISYSANLPMVAATQATAGTDATGNQWAAGHTGSTTAIQPGSSPAVPEPWHDLRPLQNSFTGTVTGYYPPQYRLTSINTVEIFGAIGLPASFNSVTWAVLPVGYRPNKTVYLPIAQISNGGSANTNSMTAYMTVDSSGNCQLHGLGTTSNPGPAFVSAQFPLDSTGMIQS